MKFTPFLIACLIFCQTAWAQPVPAVVTPSLSAKAYVLYDYNSGQFLVNQNGDSRMEPASLTKLMTAYLAFDAIRHGTITLKQMLIVPENAVHHANGESLMLLKAGQSVSVDDLLHGLIIESGNDAAITLAKYIAGSVLGFVDMMNKEAQQLGMTNTHFVNPVGLPDENHYTSAHDLALLAAAIVRDYPDFYAALFSKRDFSFNDVTQANRNRLLWLDPNVDGLKTGHTAGAGFCLVGSAKREQHRMISVVMGDTSDSLRANESLQLLNFGFQNFDVERLYEKNKPVTELRIWKGTQRHVAVGFSNDLVLSIPKGQFSQLKATLETHQPIIAPIDSSVPIGTFSLTLAGQPYASYPIYPLENVSAANVLSRGWDSIRLLIQKYMP